MRNTLLIGVAAAALFAGTALVSAQQDKAAAPAEKMAPADQKAGSEDRMKDKGAKPGQKAQTPASGKTGDRMGGNNQGAKPDEKVDKPRSTTGQAQPQTGQAQPQTSQTPTEPRTGQGKKDSQPKTGQTQTQDRMAPAQKGTAERAGTKDRMGQGERSGTSTSATLTTEQRTKIRETVLKSSSATRVSRSDIKFNVRVGTVVPRTVRLVVVPTEVVEIYPSWRGYLYFLVGDEIIVVEPRTLRIVAILEA
jgi:uncharacterized protein DUF1236